MTGNACENNKSILPSKQIMVAKEKCRYDKERCLTTYVRKKKEIENKKYGRQYITRSQCKNP